MGAAGGSWIFSASGDSGRDLGGRVARGGTARQRSMHSMTSVGVLAALRRLGLHMTDVHPGNIAFDDPDND